ncbi:MAG TPA: hypothetical protein VKG82_01165 [Solirubrobacteraceae bacterium]|nr:hypothetical protein [Solirubrobacteraceae bacterium]
MSTAPGRFANPIGGVHPAVLQRRRRRLLLLGASALIPLILGLAISVEDSNPSLLLAVALIGGTVGIVTLVTNRRLEVSVLLLAVYLGLLEGPVKLGSGGHEAASVVRDVLIFAVALGAFMRLLASRKPITLPPLSGWVLAFATLVLIEALNPNTQSITKALGGYRQQLEWLPFFFFGYALMRSKRRFRQFFLILGVIALANGVMSTYQTRLSPGQLASWGPGYHELVYGSVVAGTPGGLSGRAFSIEGQARIRPPALGTDAGSSGGFGVLAIPALLALLASVGLRRRWPIVLLLFGALAGVATGQGRLQVIGAVLAILCFVGLSFSAGKRVTRPLAVILGITLLALPAGAVFVSALGSGTFARYSNIAPENVSSQTSDVNGKTASLEEIPKTVEHAPFGVGLGSVGAAGGFGGLQTHEGLESHGVSAETQYNFVVDELGLPGLLLWCALTIRLLTLGITGLRRIPDVELRLYLAALIATILAFTIMGFSGPTMASAAFGPFFWFSAGTFAYWFITKRRQDARATGLAPRRGLRAAPLPEPA